MFAICKQPSLSLRLHRPSESVSWDICRQLRSISVCTFAQSDQGHLFSHTDSFHTIECTVFTISTQADKPGPQVIKHFFMLNSAEQEFCLANKSQSINNYKFFLAEHSCA